MHILKNRSAGFWSAFGLVLISAIGMVDFHAHPQLNMTLLYFLPIILCELLVSAEVGLFMTVFASVTWTVGHSPMTGSSMPLWVQAWNSISTLLLFLSVNASMGLLRAAGLKETTALRTDPLSGLMNRMGFTEAVQREIARTRRYKKIFSLIFINADEFKAFNAQVGHPNGDHAIEIVGRLLKQGTRASDLVARLGNDEFVAFLPDMDAETARMAMNRLQGSLHEAMQHRNWKMTFRLASSTFLTTPETIEDFLQQTERAQFALRAAAKSSIKHQIIN